MDILQAVKIIEAIFEGLTCDEIVYCLKNTEKNTKYGERPYFIRDLILYKIGKDITRDAFSGMTFEEIIQCMEFAKNIKYENEASIPYTEAIAFYKTRRKLEKRENNMSTLDAVKIVNELFRDPNTEKSPV